MSSASDLKTAVAITEMLRSSVDPFWTRLRLLLEQKGLAPATVALGICFPDDHSYEFGVLACLDGRIFTFGFDYLHRPIEQGELVEWEDISAILEQTPYDDYAKTARRVLEQIGTAI